LVMKRTMLQLNLKGCDEAIKLYKKAFDATVETVIRDSESNVIFHAEIKAFDQWIAFSEKASENVVGNTMQFCFHFGEGNEEIIKKAYEVLKDGARIDLPFGTSVDWSPCVIGLVDKFGVNWCLYI